MKTIECVLKKGKEKPVLNRHPWIFSGAIDQIQDNYQAGDLVRVLSSEKEFLGIGYFSPDAAISIRMLAFKDIPIDESFFEQRIHHAVQLRARLLPPDTDTYRVIHSEGDFLPGLVVDRYADFLVLQIHTAGMNYWRESIIRCLLAELPVRGIFEKSDKTWREPEGLEEVSQVAAGIKPPGFIDVKEYGHSFLIDIYRGQKTGAFLDQRENRKVIESLSRGKSVLNCFSYAGGFSVYAAAGGALRTVSVDASESALQLGRMNMEKNGFSLDSNMFIQSDVFDYVRQNKEKYDVVILDPPAFCKSKHQIQPAARGYKDINLKAFKLVKPHGLLFTASCSSYIDPDLFQKIIFSAAADAKRDVRIISKHSHSFDHPINIYHPEGEYLKALLCEVL